MKNIPHLILSILLIFSLISSGCSWHQRNEARFFFAPWSWVPPTPRVLEDNQKPGYNVQVRFVWLGVKHSDPTDVVQQTGLSKLRTVYVWGKLVAQGTKIQTEYVPGGETADQVVFRILKYKTNGKIIKQGSLKARPYLICAGAAWYDIL